MNGKTQTTKNGQKKVGKAEGKSSTKVLVKHISNVRQTMAQILIKVFEVLYNFYCFSNFFIIHKTWVTDQKRFIKTNIVAGI